MLVPEQRIMCFPDKFTNPHVETYRQANRITINYSNNKAGEKKYAFPNNSIKHQALDRLPENNKTLAIF